MSSLPDRLVPRARVGATVLLLAWVGLAGCRREDKGAAPGAKHGVGGLGVALSEAAASDLRTTPDGKYAAYLVDAQKPRLEGIPPQMVLGALHVVPIAGGPARQVGTAVTNVPGGFLFSADSRWLFVLSGYNAAFQSGQLEAVDLRAAEAKPAKLGGTVTYVLPSPDSQQLAFVDNGVLKLGPLPGGPYREVAGEVTTAQFSPDSKTLFFKRKLTAAGGLFAVRVAGSEPPKKLADQVGDYTISPDSKYVALAQRSEVVRSTYDLLFATVAELSAVKLATGTAVFAFSPDGKWLARTEGGKPELFGDLFVGPAEGGPGRKVGTKVSELSFSPDSSALAFLELYDISARAGLLSVVSLPDGKPKRIGERCPNYTWGSDGKVIAFLSRFVKPAYSVDLMLYPLGEDAPFKVYQGVFGYGFGPQNEYLVFRSNCIRNARACDLFQVDIKNPKTPPKKIVEGIFSFKSAEKGDRILLSYARTEVDSYDVAVFNTRTGERKTLDQHARLPAMFIDAEGSGVAYAVIDRSRAGVYVARQVP